MSFDQVPVACVEPSWLRQFLQSTADRLLGEEYSVCLMPTDSHRESLYLCSQIRLRFAPRARIAVLELSPLDPTLGWEGLFGLPDSTPIVNVRTECDLLIIRGGNYLPTWFLKKHWQYLNDLSARFRVHVLIPVSRICDSELAVSGIPAAPRLSVPSLPDVDSDCFRQFVESAIIDKMLDLRDSGNVDRSAERNRLFELVRDASPTDRTFVEDVLEFYAERFDPDSYSSIVEFARDFPPNVVLGPRLDSFHLSERIKLQSEFSAAITRLGELNVLFQNEFGERLLSHVQNFGQPFDSCDPMHWLIGTISHLSCLFFDAGKKTGLAVILDFDYEPASRSLVRHNTDSFLGTLRVLRTYFQHNLNRDDPSDRKKLAAAHTWFKSQTGTEDSYTRECSRVCVASLLRAFTTTLERIERVISRIPTANEVLKNEIRKELSQRARTYAEHEIDQVLETVVCEQGIEVDWRTVKNKHEGDIIKEVKESTCPLEALDGFLRSVCEKYCYEACRQPPRVTGILQAAGLSGRLIGEALGKLRDEWEANPHMSDIEYRRRATELANDFKSPLKEA